MDLGTFIVLNHAQLAVRGHPTGTGQCFCRLQGEPTLRTESKVSGQCMYCLYFLDSSRSRLFWRAVRLFGCGPAAVGPGFFQIVPVLIFRFISIYQWTTAAIQGDDLVTSRTLESFMYDVGEAECAAAHCRTLHPAPCRSICSKVSSELLRTKF